jgi:hypothetical protein
LYSLRNTGTVMTCLQKEIRGKMSPVNLDILKNVGFDGWYHSGCYRRMSWSHVACVCSEMNFFSGFTRVRQRQRFAECVCNRSPPNCQVGGLRVPLGVWMLYCYLRFFWHCRCNRPLQTARLKLTELHKSRQFARLLPQGIFSEECQADCIATTFIFN